MTQISLPQAVRGVTVLFSRGKAEGLLCPSELGLKNAGGMMEAVHASGLALAFGSELINPWLPELGFGFQGAQTEQE